MAMCVCPNSYPSSLNALRQQAFGQYPLTVSNVAIRVHKARRQRLRNNVTNSLSLVTHSAWVKANLQYAIVIDDIRPLREHIKELTGPLEASRERIQQCEDNLKVVDSNVSTLKAEFGTRTGEAEAIKIDLQKATSKVASAKDLLTKLSGEKLRWEHQVRTKQTVKTLKTDVACRLTPEEALLPVYCLAFGFAIILLLPNENHGLQNCPIPP